MKKTLCLALFLLLVFAFAFSACDNGDQPQTSNDTPSGTTEYETDAHVHAFSEWLTVKEATCTVKGEQERSCSCGEKETKNINAVGHTEVIDAAVAATCKSTGLTEGSHCSVCDKKLVEQTVLPIIDIHTPVTDAEVPATCKSTGLTEGSHCKICDEILVAQDVLPMTAHIFTDNKCGTCDTYIPSNGLHLEYDSANNRYLVLGIGTCTDKRVVIPSEVDGVPVVRIERNAFKDTSSFYEIVIPNSIVTMMPDAFKNSSVESVILPDSLEAIPNSCFNNCTNLSSITFPQSLYSIGEYAFYNCKKLPSTLVFPERLQYIKAYAFANCTSIKKMIFSDRLIKISHDAFTNVQFEQIKYDGTSYQWKEIVETGWCSNYQNYLLVCLNGSF